MILLLFGFWNLSGLLNLCVCVLCACVCVSVNLAAAFWQTTRWTISRSVSAFPIFLFFVFFFLTARRRKRLPRVASYFRRFLVGPLRTPAASPDCALIHREREKNDSPESAVYKFVSKEKLMLFSTEKNEKWTMFIMMQRIKKKKMFIHVQISSIQNKSLSLLSVVRFFFF